MATPVRESELDSLAHLEERITRAVEVLTRMRGENEAFHTQLDAVAAERDAARKEAAAANAQVQKLTQELEDMRGERKQVRTRIEKLLGQMDLLGGS